MHEAGCMKHDNSFLPLASCFLLLLFVLMLPSSAFAADLGEISVTSDAEHESQKSPSNFTTVIRPTKYETQSKTVAEIISESVGVDSKDLGGPGQYSTVTIRGSSAEQVTVLIDGVKINTMDGSGVDFSSIPVSAIEKIEVVRGGGTTVFGPDAIGGVINIITKKAKAGKSVEINETFGSFTTFKSSESLFLRRKAWGLGISHTHSQSKGDFTFKSAGTNMAGVNIGGGKTFTRIHNGFISEDLLTKFDITKIQNLQISILNDFFFTKRDVPGMEEETTVLYPANPLEAKETIFKNISNAFARLSNILDNHLSLELGISNNLSTDHFNDPSPAVGPAIDRESFGDSINPYLLIEPSFSHKALTQLLTLRYDFEVDLFHDGSKIPNTQLIGHKLRYYNGVFFQNELLFENGRFSIIPGIRYEKASDFSDDVGMKIGVAAKPASFLTFKGNIERSFRYPNFSELYFPDQGYMRGNKDLSKEDAINYDVGFIISHKIAELEFSYFRNDIKNQIVWVPISATTIQPINTYDVNAYGIEAGAYLNPIKFITIEGNYTWLSAHFASNNFQLPGRPSHKANLHLEAHGDFKKNFFGGSVFGDMQYVSALPVNAQNTVFIAERVSINLGATAKLLPKDGRFGAFTLTFASKDITNAQIYDARGFPLPRRSFFITLGAKWS